MLLFLQFQWGVSVKPKKSLTKPLNLLNHFRRKEADMEYMQAAILTLQTEYSLWSRDPEDEILPTVRELGIGFVAYSPLGRGFLSGAITKPEDLDPNDFRLSKSPRFQGENFYKNLQLVEQMKAIAAEKTPRPVSLLWLGS
jgi:aryl-alcohol dehydrogenase-like predicted oxidoreductase